MNITYCDICGKTIEAWNMGATIAIDAVVSDELDIDVSAQDMFVQEKDVCRNCLSKVAERLAEVFNPDIIV